MNQKTYIAFDQYQRYQTIENVIEFYRQGDPQKIFNILEIGSNEHKDLRLFLPNDKIVFTDIALTETMKQDPDFQQADGTDLQFEDNSFDFVVATDVLEHVPERKRTQFCQELCRVSRIASAICFPYYSEENRDAEERINTYFKGLYGSDFIWLKEHMENGLPLIEEINEIYNDIGYPYTQIFHGNLKTWEKMWYCHFDTCGEPSTYEYRREIDHYYNTTLYNSDIDKPCYRAFYICQKKENNEFEKYIHSLWKDNDNKSDMLDILLKNHYHMAEQNARKNKDLGQNPQTATLYWAKDNQPLQETNTFKYEYSSAEHDIRMRENLDSSVTTLRFDPMEAPCMVEDLHVYSDMGALSVIPENGVFCEGKYVFLDRDPRIQIILDGKQVTKIDLRARVTPLVFHEQQELLALLFAGKQTLEEKQSQLIQKLDEQKNAYEAELNKQKNAYEAELNKQKNAYEAELNKQKNAYKKNLEQADIENKKILKEKEELQASLTHYTLHYNAAINQREDLKQQLAYFQNAYNVISNAFFWKITKPLRIFVDILKKPLRKSQALCLIGKGIRCLKANGMAYTLNKVKEKRKYMQDAKRGAKIQVLSEAELQLQREKVFQKKIKFSILTPLYNTSEHFLREMIESVQAQTYANWELCLSDGSDAQHDNVRKIVQSYVKRDKRIKYQKLKANKGISENTNACIELATGDYIAFLDHDDVLSPNALYEVMCEIDKSGADYIYSDEATFAGTIDNIVTPHYKPEYSPDTLRVVNYICHFSVVSRELLDKTGKLRSKYDGSQDHDFTIRATDNAKLVKRIPKFLYFWRYHPNSTSADISTKSYAIEAAYELIREDALRRGMSATVESLPICPTMYRIRYEIKGNPKVSILIPTKDAYNFITDCVDSILELTTYENYEIVIIDTGSTVTEVFDYYKSLQKYENVKVLTYDKPFNYSDVNNFGAEYAVGDQILLLNNDTKVITPDWIQEMLMYAQRNDVGAVGAKLYYEDETIQHAGVGIGIFGLAGHYFNGLPRDSVGYMGRLYWVQNLSAVTGACVMIPKKVWDEVHGLDNFFDIAFSDIDICMRIRRAGYLVVWTPFAELYHFESKTLGYMTTPEKQKRFQADVSRFKKRFAKELAEGDPYYNPNLTLERTDYTLK